MALPIKIEKSLAVINNIDIKPYMNWKDSVTNAFKEQALNGAWDSFIRHINHHTISYLHITSDILDIHKQSYYINNDELEEILESIDSLVSETILSNINLNFKFYITSQLNNLKESIIERNISGVEPIVDIINASLANIAFSRDTTNEIVKCDIWKKFFKIMARAASVITVAGVMSLPASTIYNKILDFGNGTSKSISISIENNIFLKDDWRYPDTDLDDNKPNIGGAEDAEEDNTIKT